MCKMVEIQRGAIPSNITIEFQRDTSSRVMEVVIVNRDQVGEEKQGIKLLCFDNGKIKSNGPVNILEGVDIL